MRSTFLAGLQWLRAPLALAGFIVVMTAAFAWPASNLEPRDVPIALTGSSHFVTSTTRLLSEQAPGAFDITVAPTVADGRAMLDENKVDGVFEESRSGPDLVLGEAGRPAVAALLTSMEGRLRGVPSSGVVTAQVPPPRDDPSSAVFTAAALPTVLGASAAGAVLAMGRRSRHDRLLSTVAVAALAGVGLTLVLNTWLDALSGSWWALAGCYALGVGGIVAAMNGLSHHFGRAGLAVAGATLMLLGNPLSGATSAPEMLPRGWSALGQILPPGAMANATRAIGFYDDNGASSSVLILGAWALVGSVLLLVGSTTGPSPRRGRPAEVPHTVPRVASRPEVHHPQGVSA